MVTKFKTMNLKELENTIGGRHSVPYSYGYQSGRGFKGAAAAYNIIKTVASFLNKERSLFQYLLKQTLFYLLLKEFESEILFLAKFDTNAYKI